MELNKLPEVRFDWPAYFRKFCELHGEPVRHKGRLLFKDGYQYSASDYAGPEWPPPEDASELAALVRAYWSERLRMVQVEIAKLKDVVKAVFEAQAGRSAPLQQVVSYVVDDDGKRRVEASDIDRQALIERMKWLVDDAIECERELRGLSDERQEPTVAS